MQVIQGQTITRSANILPDSTHLLSTEIPQTNFDNFIATQQAEIAAQVSGQNDKPLLRVDVTNINIVRRNMYNLVVVTFTPFWGE